MRKTLPDAMFSDPERSRLTMLRTWVLDNAVTEIEMNERQFWNFAQLQPVSEKPWVTFMGRIIAISMNGDVDPLIYVDGQYTGRAA